MTNEEIQNKIARMFNMGAYGDLLAQALLYEYAHNLAEELRTSETLRDWTDDHMGDVELAATWIDPWS